MKNFSSRTRESSPRNSKGNPWKPFLWIVGAFLVLVFAKEILGSVASVITAPVFSVRHYIETSAGTVPVFFRSQRDLLAQIRDLEFQIQNGEGASAVQKYLERENEELRKLSSGTTTSPVILAGVVARPPFTPYDTLIIDRGEADGIVRYAPVYIGEHQAAGYVREVSKRNALVTLFSSPDAEATVYVFGPNIFTQAYGEGGGVVRISVPQGMSVAEGDVVLLPGLDAGVLGTVDYVESMPTEPEQRAYVIFDTPLQSVRIVAVGTSPVRPTPFAEAEATVAEAERGLFSISVPEGYGRASTTWDGKVATTTP